MEVVGQWAIPVGQWATGIIKTVLFKSLCFYFTLFIKRLCQKSVRFKAEGCVKRVFNNLNKQNKFLNEGQVKKKEVK